jgi:tetratricopeptide (TPR) repeat protein
MSIRATGLVLAGGLLCVLAGSSMAQTAQTSGNQSPAIQAGRDVTITYGLTPEQVQELIKAAAAGTILSAPLWLQERYDALLRQSSLTNAALERFFRDLGEDPVAPKDVDAKLRAVVVRFHTVEAQVAGLPKDSPIKRAANAALQAGAYDRAEALVALARDQVRAVKLIDKGQPDQALALLDDVERRLDDISPEATPLDRTQRGYNYKTYAEALFDKGQKASADRYLDLAARLFEQVRNDSSTPRDVFASAVNGTGNVHQLRGQYREAIADYQIATSILPNYAYAWHDMFSAYLDMAKRGDIDVAGMRHALDETRANAANTPGLNATYLTKLEAIFAQYSHLADTKQGPQQRVRP